MLMILTIVLSYISYNAFLFASGALLLYFAYVMILTTVEMYRTYKRAIKRQTDFKNKHTRKI